MKKLYRANTQYACDGLEHQSQQRSSNSASLVLDEAHFSDCSMNDSVSTIFSLSRTWTIASENAQNDNKIPVIRPNNALYARFLVIRCILRFLLIGFCIFGASYARIFCQFNLSKHNLDNSQWTEYKFMVAWLSINYVFDFMDFCALMIDLFCLDRSDGNSQTRKEIVQSHYSKAFILDIIGSIPLELFFLSNINALLLIRSIKILKLFVFLHDFDYLISEVYKWSIYQHPISRNIFYSVALFASLLYVYASIWFSLSYFRPIIDVFLQSDDVMKAFFMSIYNILVTMCAVGYGDITPVNTQQVGLIVIVEITGFVILTNIIGSFVPYFFQSMIEEFEFTHRRDLILRYLSKNGNDSKIKEKTMDYFSNLWTKCRGLDDNAIFSKYLPLHLRREVGEELVGKILRDEKIFANAPSSFLRCLVDNLEFGFYLENDIIFNCGIVLDKLPILLSGDVEEFTFDETNKRIMLRSITDGRLFAQNEFISAQPINSNFESKTNGLEIVYIHRSDWDNLLAQYPIVAEQINEYTNKRKNARGIIKSPQSKKLALFSNDDDDKDKQKSIEGLYLPHSHFLQRWNMGNFIGLIMYIFFNSMVISFANNRKVSGETWTILAVLWLTDIFFIFDIYFRKTKFAITRGENIISDPDTVSKIYMKRDIYLDIFAIFPFEWIIFFISPQFMVLGRLNRYVRLFRFTSSFRNALDFGNITGSKRNMVLTFCTIAVMLHLLACLWYMVGGISHSLDGFGEKNWIYVDKAIDINDQTLFRYIRCVYFAFLTSFTIGYGGIVPVNFAEQIICMMLIVIGTSGYFMMMALITVWAEQANRIALNFERNFEIVKHVLSELNVNEKVNNDVRSFMSQLWSNQYGYRDETVLNLLPHNIRVSIMDNLSLGVLGNISFFNSVPKGFMNELLLAFKIKSFCPNEVMFAGDVVSDFFIVYQGTCLLKAVMKNKGDEKGPKSQQKKMITQDLCARDYFGLEAIYLFNQVKEAKKLKTEKQNAANRAKDDDENSDEQKVQTKESAEKQRRKRRARRHRLSYYTSFEYEERALRDCPFEQFAVCSDSSGFSTIIAITNCEFEELLLKFPKVKEDILNNANLVDEDISASFSTAQSRAQSKRPSIAQSMRPSIVSSPPKMEIIPMENEINISFDNTMMTSFSSSLEHHDFNSHRESQFSLTNPNGLRFTGHGTKASGSKMPNSSNFHEVFGLIHPLSNFKLWWNIISLLLCLYNMMIVPYRISFINERGTVSGNAGFILFDVLIDLFFCVDIYMRLDRFAFTDEGFVEPNKSVIRARYIGIQLVLDILSSLPWALMVIAIIIQPSSWNALWSSTQISLYYWMRAFTLLRLYQLLSYMNEIDAFIEDRRIRIKPTMLRIVYQILFVLIVCHWGACVFYWIAKDQYLSEHNWLLSTDSPVYYDENEPNNYMIPVYVLSTYWSLVSMSSIGFGDIKPQTIAETCSGLIVMILGVLAYATTTAFIASFAAHANPPSESFREKSQPIEKYLKTLKLSNQLKERSDSYFDELWKRFKGVSPLTAISCVSDSLQVRILESILSERLTPLDIFRNAPVSFIKACAQNMKHELYILGEKIVRQNTESDKMYLLFEGAAKGTSGSRDGRIFVAGTTFSKQALINTRWVEPGTVEATKNCHIFTLRREEFADIVASKKEWRKYLFSSNFVTKANSVVKGNNKMKKMMTMSLSADEYANRSVVGEVDAENALIKISAFAALLFNLWINAFQFAFLTETKYEKTLMITCIVCWFSDIIFMADWIRTLLFVKSKSASISGQKITGMKDNVFAYFNENRIGFILHIIVLLPIDLILYFAASPYYCCLYRMIARIYHFGQFAHLSEIFFRKIRANPVQKLLISMICVIYLSVHNLSCIFSVVANKEIYGVLNYSNAMEHYLLSIYFVITVVTTTGYGDITPQTAEQIGFCIILVFCGNAIYAGTIGIISSWVGSTYSRILDHFNQLKEIEAFCQNKKLNDKLSEKILFSHNESFNQRSREQTKNLFPARLQKQCSHEIYGKFIGSFEYFDHLSSKALNVIARNISTQEYFKGDVIMSRGDLNDKLHILLSGKVFLVKYKENSTNSLQALPLRRSSLTQGSWFGDYSFFMSQPCAISTIAASETVETLTVSRKVLKKVVESLGKESNESKHKSFYKSLENYHKHIEKDAFENIEVEESEVIVEEVDDAQDKSIEFDARHHPFLFFLERFLEVSPVQNKENIIKAAKFWKVNMNEVDRLMNEIKVRELTPECSPCSQKQLLNDLTLDLSGTEDEESDEDIVRDSLKKHHWIEHQHTFYEGFSKDERESKVIKKIQSRFENHDRQNTANCLIM